MSNTITKSHYCHGLNGVKVGFVFSYPGSKNQFEGKPLNGMAVINLNHLLCRLNKSYPILFPFCKWNSYRITNSYTKKIYPTGKKVYDLEIISDENNLKRIKDEIKGIDTLICFGEKAYFAAKKTVDRFSLNHQLIKVMNFNNSNVSRSIQSQNKKNTTRVRTNFRVLEVYNDIIKKISLL